MPELHVTLIKASDLPASDTGFTGRKSDPYVTFELGWERVRSTTIKNELNPVWKPSERFEFDVADVDTQELRVRVMDYDNFNADDTIGTMSLPVSNFVDHANEAIVETYALDIPSEFNSQNRHSTLQLEIRLVMEEPGQLTLRVWENEMWEGGAWVPADNKAKRHWSTYDNQVSAHSFEDVAPPVPEGYESESWGFSTRKGDNMGWLYASSFSSSSWEPAHDSGCYARRRLWERLCSGPAE